MTTPVAHGMAMRFSVVVQGISLGDWASCKGLQVNCNPVRFREPGNNDFEQIIFGDISYPTVKLERAMDSRSSTALAAWLRTEMRAWGVQPATVLLQQKWATITLLDAAWRQVSSWTLRGVVPVAWIGPTLSAKDNGVAIETLELAHQGFLA
jgi:phage tail-like protein